MNNSPSSSTYLTSCPTVNTVVGRQGELQAIHTHLQADKPTVVVNGLGGIGKTTLALEYIKQYEHTYRHIVWLVQNASLLSTFTDCYDLVKDFDFTQKTEPIRLKIVLEKLAAYTGTNLLVIDNFQEHELDKTLHTLSYLTTAQMRHWKILVTSREDIAPFHTHTLTTLPAEAATELFHIHCPDKNIIAAELEILLEEIGYHTLMIELLAKNYRLNPNLKNIAQLTAHLQKNDIENKELQKLVWTEHSQEEIRLYTYLTRIFTIETLDDNARYILQQFAVLPPKTIYYKTFLEWIGDEAQTYLETMESLVKKGWLHCTNNDTYGMHRLIQLVILKLLPPTYQNCAILHDNIGEALGSDAAQAQPLAHQWLIEYGESLLQTLDYQDQEIKKAYLQNRIASLYKNNSNYSKSLVLYEQALQICETISGRQHQDTAIILNNIAKVYYHQDNHVKALALHKEVLQIRENILKKGHLDIAGSLNDIANIYNTQKNYIKALSLYKEALKIVKINLGEQHPHTATCLNNIANIYHNQKNYAKALPLFKEALQIRKEILGEKHPNTIGSMYDISILYINTQQYDKGISLLRQVCHAWQEVLGLEHPNTQIALRALKKYMK